MKFNVAVKAVGKDNYLAFVPLIPGCYANGVDEDDVCRNISNAIRVFVSSLIERGFPVPKSRSREEFRDGYMIREVDVDLSNNLEEPDAVSQTVAAKVLHVSLSRVSALISNGELETKEVAEKRLVTNKSLRELIAKRFAFDPKYIEEEMQGEELKSGSKR